MIPFNSTKRSIIILLGLTLLIGSCTSQEEENWRPLFNGENLEGWTIKMAGFEAGKNYNNTFRVEEGLLRVDYSEYDSFRLEFGHIFFEQPFRHYRLRLEYRFLGDPVPGTPSWAIRNSGVMFHAQSPESMAVDQGFPVSLEAQFLGAYQPGLPRPTANLCTPGMHVIKDGSLQREHCLLGDGPTIFGADWVRFELLVLPDGNIHHLINGDTAISYSDPVIGGDYLPYDFPAADLSPVTEGYIALQAEGHPVEFRNIELIELD